MGSVKDTLIEFADEVIGTFQLSEDSETFDKVQVIIMENTLLTPDTSKHDVVKFFQDEIICPHCLSFDGKNCNCSKKERL